MLVDEIWDFKSINMGRELEISGEFIYESAKKTMSITGLNNQYEINIILYTGAVGIERLQKIYLCLVLQNPTDKESVPKCLVEHNHHELEKEIEEVTRRERINAINTCRELIQKFDLQPAEIGLKKLMRKGAMIPKFMGPKGETWTGRGRKPIWLQQAELEGKSLEDFRITSPVAMEEDEDARLEELTRPDNVKA